MMWVCVCECLVEQWQNLKVRPLICMIIRWLCWYLAKAFEDLEQPAEHHVSTDRSGFLQLSTTVHSSCLSTDRIDVNRWFIPSRPPSTTEHSTANLRKLVDILSFAYHTHRHDPQFQRMTDATTLTQVQFSQYLRLLLLARDFPAFTSGPCRVYTSSKFLPSGIAKFGYSINPDG